MQTFYRIKKNGEGNEIQTIATNSCSSTWMFSRGRVNILYKQTEILNIHWKATRVKENWIINEIYNFYDKKVYYI